MKRIGATIIGFLAILLPALCHAGELPQGWTPAGKIPEKYDRLVTCAEKHNPVCQVWLANLWLGMDWYIIDIDRTSEIYNPPEAEPWLRRAAEYGYPTAMWKYGHLICLSKYWNMEVRRSRMIEGMAWQLASGPKAEKQLEKRDPFFCPMFSDAVEANPDESDSLIALARKRAEKIKAEVANSNGFWLSLMEPCTPFSWTKENDPFLVPFRSCLSFNLRDFLEHMLP